MTPKNPAAVALGRRGGKATASSRSPEQRTESARRAANARWAKLKNLVADITERSKALEKKALAKATKKKAGK